MELSFRKHDLITVFGEMDEDGFYIGELDGVRGLVPSNFLEPHSHSYSSHPSAALASTGSFDQQSVGGSGGRLATVAPPKGVVFSDGKKPAGIQRQTSGPQQSQNSGLPTTPLKMPQGGGFSGMTSKANKVVGSQGGGSGGGTPTGSVQPNFSGKQLTKKTSDLATKNLGNSVSTSGSASVKKTSSGTAKKNEGVLKVFDYVF